MSLLKLCSSLFDGITMDRFELGENTIHKDKADVSCHTTHPASVEEGNYENDSSHAYLDKQVPRKELSRELNMRHLCFLTLGSGIGTGLFIGSGNILSSGGPGSLMIGFILLGLMVITVIFAVGELVATFPSAGSYSHMLSRFVHPSFGFAVGVDYLMTWLIIFPTELTAACMIIRYWDKDEVVPKGIWVALIVAGVLTVNMFGARVFGEVEMLTTTIKMLSCVGFIICCVVIVCGGAPNHHYLGAGTWHNPGAFNNGFKGFSNAFAFAALAYGGTEVIGVTVGEAGNPRKQLPKASKFVVYRVIIFFILSLFMVTLLVPYDEPNLVGSSSSPRATPFVLALKRGKIHALPAIFNAVILLSVVSVSNTAVYTGSRLLYSMAESGFLPKIFMYSDRKGRPMAGFALLFLFGLLGFLVYSSSEDEIFSWLGSISGMSVILLWMCISLAHVRFRYAWKKAGYRVSDLPWTSPLGEWGSWFALILNILVLMATFYISAFPIGEAEMDGYERGKAFFQSYLSVVIIIVAFFAHKLFTGARFVRIHEIDLHTGRRDPHMDSETEPEARADYLKPRWRRILEVFF